MYRTYRVIEDPVKRRLEINDIVGIQLHKSFNSVVIEAGGYENLTCLEKDCRNYVEKVRRLRLGEGDAAALQAYFVRMEEQCPCFFYSIDMDPKGHAKNIFWADSYCRHAYIEFGDVVTFDTTYLTNKYEMSFAPFVWVNHHGESILLGCGLISAEDAGTFKWLFKTWLRCLHNQAPVGIITAQDKAMKSAIEEVFPQTKHRWCLWHILKKLPENFVRHTQKADLIPAIKKIVYNSLSTDEFELGWASMMEEYPCGIMSGT